MPVEPIRTGHFATPLSLSPTREQREILFVKKSAGGGMSGGQGGLVPFVPQNQNEHAAPTPQSPEQFRQQNVLRVVQATRTRLAKVLGNITELGSESGVLQTASFQQVLREQNDIVDQYLALVEPQAIQVGEHEAKKPVSLDWEKDTRNLTELRKAERVIDTLDAFRSAISTIAVRELNTSEFMAYVRRAEREMSDAEIDHIRAFYDHEAEGGSIFIREGIPETERKKLELHERDHGILRHAKTILGLSLVEYTLRRIEQPRNAMEALNASVDTVVPGAPAESTFSTLIDSYSTQVFGDKQAQVPRATQQAFATLQASLPQLQPEALEAAFRDRMLVEPATPVTSEFRQLFDVMTEGDYAPFGTNVTARFEKMMIRYHRWQDQKQSADSARMHIGATEEALFQYIAKTLPTFATETAQTARQELEQSAERARVFHQQCRAISEGAHALPGYRPYAGNMRLLTEELLIRAADLRMGRITAESLDPRELMAIACIDPSACPNVDIAAQSTDTPSSDGKLVFSGHADAADESGTDTDTEDTEGKAINAEQFMHSIDGLESMVKKVSNGLPAALGKLKAEGQEQAVIDSWAAQASGLANILTILNPYRRANTILAQLENNSIPPAQFANEAGAVFGVHAGSSEASELARLINEASSGGTWNTDSPAFIQLRKALRDEVNSLQSEVIKLSEQVGSMSTIMDELERGDTDPGSASWGIRFYSIKQCIDAVKNVWDSYKKAWEQWNTLRTSELADVIGKTVGSIPIYKQTMQDPMKIALEMELDHKNDDIKDAYKKHLEHDLATFGHCFDDHHRGHSLIHMNLNDPNRFRGTLEYMAGNGWLYDLDGIKGTVFGIDVKKYLPPTWPDQRRVQYIKNLEQENSSGEDNSSNKGYSRVDTLSDIPPMMDILKDELERHNFWAAKGIVKRAIEKGKMGETSAWCSTIIINSIRHDPITKRFFPINLMDQLGNIGISSPAWLTTSFKLNRKAIVKFQNGTFNNFEQAGDLAAAIKAAEDEIKKVRKASGLPDLHPESNKKDLALLNQLTAKVLACQNVEKDIGAPDTAKWVRSVSIFDDNPAFNSYRKYIQDFKGSLNPGDCDDDFYNGMDNDSSEALLKSATNFSSIFQPKSQGTFVEESKAILFIEQIIHQDTKLRDRVKKAISTGNSAEITRARAAHRNYQRMMKEKLSEVYLTAWQQGTSQAVLQIKGRTRESTDGSDNIEPLFYFLVKRDLLGHPDEYVSKLAKGKDHPMAGQLKILLDSKGPFSKEPMP